MHMKKTLSAVLSLCLTASALYGTTAFSSFAAETPQLVFDIRSEGKNEIVLSADQLKDSDVTIPVDIFIPSNPGVAGINLKLQVNDGQPLADGSFGNYGLKLTDGALANPFCFDSAAKGDPNKSFYEIFNSSLMNFSWLYSENVSSNADAAAEAKTYAWDSTVDWAYQNAFAKANLVIPKGTPAGSYKLDILQDAFNNKLGSGKVQSASKCTAIADDEEKSIQNVSFRSVPLNVKVNAAEDTGWKESYEIEGEGHYLIIGDVCGKPGESVDVPIYVYNDKGTAGMQLLFNLRDGLKLTDWDEDLNNAAYTITNTQFNPDSDPAVFVFASSTGTVAKNGSIVAYLTVKIPENAEAGKTYDIDFCRKGEDNTVIKVVDYDTEALDVEFYNGSVTVITDKEPALNRNAISFSAAGQTSNLTLFNSTGAVEWTSSDPSVATVDKNGFVKATGLGSATITAVNNGKNYTCAVNVGLPGDVNRNGKIDARDPLLVLQEYTYTFVGEEGVLDDAQKQIADANGNGKIDQRDCLLILRYYTYLNVSKIEGVTWDDVIHGRI